MRDKVLPNQLQPGDVLLYHGTGFISDMIRLFDGSDYSHAALFNGQNVVEAIASGITAGMGSTSWVRQAIPLSQSSILRPNSSPKQIATPMNRLFCSLRWPTLEGFR